MITYFCKYTPLELLSAMGLELTQPNKDADDFRHADALIHSSVCMHAKLLLEECASGSADNADLILTNCCDSVRRVYDTVSLEPALSDRLHSMIMLDLPHEDFGRAVDAWTNELLRLKAAFPDHPFDRAKFLELWKKQADDWEIFSERGPFIAILGARVSNELRARIRDAFSLPVIDLTCGGLRSIPQPPKQAFLHRCDGCTGDPSAAGNLEWTMSDDELFHAYAEALLRQVPCTRMEQTSAREKLYHMPSLIGVIYHSVKFCDYYSFEYAEIRRNTPLPILKIETDFTAQSVGQMDTRLAAFAESLSSSENAAGTLSASGTSAASASENASASGSKPAFKKGNAMLFTEKNPKASAKPAAFPAENDGSAVYIGIDSGSTSTNVAAISPDGTLLAYSIVRTGAKAGDSAKRALEDVKVQLGRRADNIRRIIATGYGREFITFADSTKTEISCHARGAHFLDPEARCIIDIGGQDSKVICLDEDGNVANFVMNDKCAAGTGRFLEMMAHTLETDLSSMSKLGLKWKKELTISSTCTVFAESEVVSLIAENTEPSDIVHALNKSVAGRTTGMVKRVRGEGPYMMTGGVARNQGVAKEIEHRLGSSLFIAEYPDLIGAIGAALFAVRG